MSIDQIQEHKAKYARADKEGNYALWDTSFNEMALKTVLRKLINKTCLLADIQSLRFKDGLAEHAAVKMLRGTSSDEALGLLEGGDKNETPKEETKPS
jgi:recombinational DNA repair protein RecT